MKLVAVNLLALVGVVALAVGIGRGPTLERWGPDGVASMWAAAVVCLSAAMAAALVVAIIALRWPAHVGQAALGGTVIRLLLTAFLGIGCQLWADVHLRSFLTWLVVLYLPLLAVETIIAVVMVRTRLGAPATRGR